MGVFKNEVGRPTNEVIKKRRILKGLIAALVIIIILLVCYIVNGKLNTNNTKNKEKIDIAIAEKILNNFVYDDFNLLTTENFSDSYKTILAIKKSQGMLNHYESCEEIFGSDMVKSADGYYSVKGHDEATCADDQSKLFYPYGLVNEKYKELFGSEYNAKKDYVTTRESGAQAIYKYSEVKDGYYELSCDCGGIWYSE